MLWLSESSLPRRRAKKRLVYIHGAEVGTRAAGGQPWCYQGVCQASCQPRRHPWSTVPCLCAGDVIREPGSRGEVEALPHVRFGQGYARRNDYLRSSRSFEGPMEGGCVVWSVGEVRGRVGGLLICVVVSSPSSDGAVRSVNASNILRESSVRLSVFIAAC